VTARSLTSCQRTTAERQRGGCEWDIRSSDSSRGHSSNQGFHHTRTSIRRGQVRCRKAGLPRPGDPTSIANPNLMALTGGAVNQDIAHSSVSTAFPVGRFSRTCNGTLYRGIFRLRSPIELGKLGTPSPGCSASGVRPQTPFYSSKKQKKNQHGCYSLVRTTEPERRLRNPEAFPTTDSSRLVSSRIWAPSRRLDRPKPSGRAPQITYSLHYISTGGYSYTQSSSAIHDKPALPLGKPYHHSHTQAWQQKAEHRANPLNGVTATGSESVT